MNAAAETASLKLFHGDEEMILLSDKSGSTRMRDDVSKTFRESTAYVGVDDESPMVGVREREMI